MGQSPNVFSLTFAEQSIKNTAACIPLRDCMESLAFPKMIFPYIATIQMFFLFFLFYVSNAEFI